MSQQRTNIYRDVLEKWHRCKREFPALDHDELFPRSEDFVLEDATAERVMLEVEREFRRTT